jgi:hypothetical protein
MIQKQIDAQNEVTDVTDEQIIQPIIPLASKSVWRDHLFRARKKDITTGQIAILPKDPDGQEMRLWLYNQNGGRFLFDSSFQGNLPELMGSDQSKLIDNTDDDDISFTRNVNWFAGDQHIRVHDNPNVRIKEIEAP